MKIIFLATFKDFKNFLGPKGKSPWITDDDGTEIADSQFIIEHLTKKHNIKMMEMSPQEAAVERAMRALLEDNLVALHTYLPESSILQA